MSAGLALPSINRHSTAARALSSTPVCITASLHRPTGEKRESGKRFVEMADRRDAHTYGGAMVHSSDGYGCIGNTATSRQVDLLPQLAHKPRI
jgi:hypothetical protein